MLTRYYEVVCDRCGWAEHFVANSAVDAEMHYKYNGGLITEDGKHYCNAKCRDKDIIGKVVKLSKG